MAGVMHETRERKGIARAAALAIQAQRISAREGHGHAVVNLEWKRCPETGNGQKIRARVCETAEVRLQYLLIRCRHVEVADILAQSQRTLIDLCACDCVNKCEPGVGGNVHLTQTAKVITNDGLLRER